MLVLPFALLIPDMLIRLGQRIYFPTPADKLMIYLRSQGKSIKIRHLNDSHANIVVKDEIGYDMRDESALK
jgi:hypothetical protein